MPSGDPPIGRAAATDQSPVVGHLEDSDANGPAAAVPPTDGTAGEQRVSSASGVDVGEPGEDRGRLDRDRLAAGENGGPSSEGGQSSPFEDGGAAGEYGNSADWDEILAAQDQTAAGEDLAAAGEHAAAAGEDQIPVAEDKIPVAEDGVLAPDEPDAPGTPPEPATKTDTAVKGLRSLRGAAATVLAGFVRVRRLGSQAGHGRRYADLGGTGFARVTVLPTVLMSAWLLIGLPLLMARAFLPAPMLLITVPVAVALATGLRWIPGAWPRTIAGLAQAAGAEPGREQARRAWWGLAGTVAVAAIFAFWQFQFNSESVIVLRDPGAYLQTGYWLAQHGSLPIPQSLQAFGGAHPGLDFASTGFFSQGTAVVPGLMSGLPLILAGAFWVHGTAAAAAMGPILGGLAVLAFGGLTGRLAGPQWAPAGALVLALTLPEQYASRASFSETAAQVLLFGGLSLVVDALTLRRRDPAPRPEPEGTGPAAGGWRRWLLLLLRGRRHEPQWALMALGGVALGLSALVRFDGLLDVLPVIPFIGVLAIRRSPAARPLGFGLAIGVVYGLVDAYLMARPFINSLRPLPELIGLIAAWLAALTLATVELMRLPGFRQGLRALLAGRAVRWLPEAGACLAVLALICLAVRPYLQTVRGPATGGAAAYVASLQRLEHLPVDPGRLYAEDTLYWVVWYVGVPAVLLGGLGVALLLRRCLRALLSWRDPSGAARVWALPLAVICFGSVAALWQPQTVPDQPWASRRLVPLVIPGLILCAIWASAWLRGRARSRGAGSTAASVVAVFCVGALFVPTVATTFGLGLTHSAKSGALRLSADGLAFKRTAPGEMGAVNRLCASLGPSATVVIVDRVVAQEFSQVIRGMCGVPVASMARQPAIDGQAIIGGIMRSGRRPVLLGARPAQLSGYAGNAPVRVLDLSTSQDPHTLTQPPTTLWPAHYVIWMTSVGPAGARV